MQTFGGGVKMKEGLNPKGMVELFTTAGKPALIFGNHLGNRVYDRCDLDFSKVKMLSEQKLYNIIVNFGKDSIINSLEAGASTTNQVWRMAIGDRGALPSDITVPKVPVATMSDLYNEVARSDLDATVKNVGTPTVHEIKFIKTFSAVTVPIAAFSNQAQPIVNEIGLITTNGAPPTRADNFAKIGVAVDENLFSIRTFKSVPFEAANEIAITVRYTIFIE